MGIERHRRDHAHCDTQHECHNGWSEIELHQVAELYQHHEEREQHDIHYAPLAGILHDAIRQRLVPSLEQAQQAEFEQHDNLDQGKDDREHEHDDPDEPVAVPQEIDRPEQQA